ncbi:hypothetical protein ABT096_10735 [Streptomyces sp. NPDC002561]|uniref:hypothetical protein n=1 Tax=Streptomyces sp. NPDC002561 TaxID=3154418 RepID=UPI003325F6F0
MGSKLVRLVGFVAAAAVIGLGVTEGVSTPASSSWGWVVADDQGPTSPAPAVVADDQGPTSPTPAVVADDQGPTSPTPAVVADDQGPTSPAPAVLADDQGPTVVHPVAPLDAPASSQGLA